MGGVRFGVGGGGFGVGGGGFGVGGGSSMNNSSRSGVASPTTLIFKGHGSRHLASIHTLFVKGKHIFVGSEHFSFQ